MDIGDKIRVTPTHWLRPTDVGVIVEIFPSRGLNMYLVEFERAFPGGGIDDKRLWMSEAYMEKLTARAAALPRRRTA